MSICNYRRLFEMAGDSERKLALSSYYRYHQLTADIAAKYHFSARVGAAVFSALSPNNDYMGNIRDVGRTLKAVRDGRNVDQLKVSTYNQNKFKAWKICTEGKDPMTYFKSDKTKSFYHNVAFPNEGDMVTIDGHMLNAWFDTLRALNDAAHHMTRANYALLADACRKLAGEQGLRPWQYQATLWFVWKRIHRRRVEYYEQTEMWIPERIVSGLGFQPTLSSRTA